MDNIMNCFAALKIQPTSNPHIIKQAYSKALQCLLADATSHCFGQLRRSYIDALRHSRKIFKAQYPSEAAWLESTEYCQMTMDINSTVNLDNASISDLRDALQLQPHNTYVLTLIAKYYIDTNKYRLAIDILESIREFSPLNTETRHLLQHAEKVWCKRLIKRFNSLSPEDMEYLILHEMRNKRHNIALTYLKKAISTRLNSLHAPTLFRMIAECMVVLRIDTASHYFEKSLEYSHMLNENPCVTLLVYIEYLFAFKHFETLLLLVDELISLDPNQHRFHYLKGESLSQTKYYKQSITNLRYAIGLSPSNADYYTSIAHAYRELGHHEKAVKYAKAGSKISTVNVDS